MAAVSASMFLSGTCCHTVAIVTMVLVVQLTLTFAQEPTRLHYTIMEELQPSTLIGSIARDARLTDKYSSEVLQTFQFNILKGKYKKMFAIEGNQGRLRTNGSLDRDRICPQMALCEVPLDVAVIHPIEYFEIIKVTIEVIDVNDNTPVFPRDRVVLDISENTMPGASFVIPGASDQDSGEFGVQEYKFVSSSQDKFELDVDNSDLRLVLKLRLDREAEHSYKMHVIALDGGDPKKSGTVEIEVKVQDSNDNSPIFDRPIYNMSIAEDAAIGDVILTVHAHDPDQGLNGRLRYGFSSTTKSQFGKQFGINATTGGLYLKKPLDYENEVLYNLIVTAEDQGPDAMATHAKVIIHVTDINDHRPKIVLNTLTATGSPQISEWADIGTFVAHISVEDLDNGQSGTVSCALHHDHFFLKKMYQSEYKIETSEAFDYEEKNSYIVTIHCQDGGDDPLTSSEDIVISIIDENDHAPIFVRKEIDAHIRENNTAHTPVTVVTATDRDTGLNGQIVYSLAKDARNLVKIVPDTGVITTNAVFDYENMHLFVFRVIATDKGNPPLVSTATVTLSIVDINDEAPIFTDPGYNFGTYENQKKATEIGTVSASDADSHPYNKFTYSIQEHYNNEARDTFHIDPQSGQIITKKVLDREHEIAYYFTVVATNVAYPYLSSSANVSLYIADTNDNAPMIEFPRPGNMTVQVPARATKGYIFCKVRAADADLGTNAKLNYAIAQGNEDDVFDMDPLSGAMSVEHDLRQERNDRYELLIVVKDEGTPPKSAVAKMTVIVNHTMVFGDAAHQSGLASNPFLALGFHQKIIVILGCVTAVLVAILVTAIVCIKRRQKYQDKETYRYMCRVDLAQRLSGLGAGDGSHVSYQDHNVDSPDSTLERPPGKDGQKMLEEQESKKSLAKISPEHISDSRTHLTLEDLQRLREVPAADPNALSRTLPRSPRPNYGVILPSQLQREKEVEVHQLLQLLKRDGDSDSTSGCSADMSNADSGKGASDEGDGRHRQQQQQRPNRQHQQELANTLDKRRLLNGGRNSPGFHQYGPPRQQHANGRAGDTRLPSPPPPPPAPTPTRQATTDSSGGFGNSSMLVPSSSECGSPLCTCPADTKQQCISIHVNKPIGGTHGAGTPYEGIHLRTFSPTGYHSPSSTLSRTANNPSPVTSSNANNSNRNSSVCSEEGGSTTSGSYVVDLENEVAVTSPSSVPPPAPGVKAVDV